MENDNPSQERAVMSDAEQFQVESALQTGQFVTDAARLSGLVAGLKSPQPLDPAQTVRELEAASTHFAILSRSDMGLMRAARLGEHTEADLSGVEEMLSLFPDEEDRQILRFASLMRDSGKSLCVKATGSNIRQKEYNLGVTKAVMDTITPYVMADDAKKLVLLLEEYDVVGGALQGYFDQGQLDEMLAKCPQRFRDKLPDLVVASYLSDARAHTAYSSFTDMFTGERLPSVTEDDLRPDPTTPYPKTLDFLFEPPASGQPLTLAQPYRRVVTAMFPGLRTTRDLMQASEVHDSPLLREYIHTTEAEGVWSATLGVPAGTTYETVKQQVEAFASSTGFPISAFVQRGRGNVVRSVTVVRDPSHRFGTLSPEDHEHAVDQMSTMFAWERPHQVESGRPDVRACVGLLEGYDKDAGTLHDPAEAVALLLEGGRGVSWQTEPTTLVSARRVLNKAGRYELEAWDEKVMVITGTSRVSDQPGSTALDQVEALASKLNQRRFFAEDGAGNRTIARAA